MNGLHELPLVIFTVFGQSVVGAFLLFSLVLFTAKDKFYRAYIHKIMFALLILLAVGFIASIMHLGSPWRAFNSLNRIGESMLSNEIAFGALFFISLALYWLLAILNKIHTGLAKIWLILTALLGLVFMYFMNQVYHVATVPTWNNAFTSCSFYLTIVLAGFSLGYCLSQSDRPDAKTLGFVPWLVAIATLVAAVVAVYQGFSLNSIMSSTQKAANLVPDFAILMAVRFTGLGLVVAMLFYIARKPKLITVKMFAIILVLASEMIGRTLFYGLHMTVGTAVGS